MKLTIDIPEQIYLNAKADLLCGGDVIVKAIKNGIPHETVTEFADRCRECGREKVLDKIRAEIEQAADKQFQIAMGVSDLNERYAHTQMENAYRHSLNVINKYKKESEDKE